MAQVAAVMQVQPLALKLLHPVDAPPPPPEKKSQWYRTGTGSLDFFLRVMRSHFQKSLTGSCFYPGDSYFSSCVENGFVRGRGQRCKCDTPGVEFKEGELKTDCFLLLGLSP